MNESYFSDPVRRAKRQVNPRLAEHVEGQQEATCAQFGTEDLLIGATTLHLHSVPDSFLPAQCPTYCA